MAANYIGRHHFVGQNRLWFHVTTVDSEVVAKEYGRFTKLIPRLPATVTGSFTVH